MIKRTIGILLSSAAISACIDPPEPTPKPTPEPIDPAIRFTPEAYTAVEANDINGTWVLTIEDDLISTVSFDDEASVISGSYRTVCDITGFDETSGLISCASNNDVLLDGLYAFAGNALVTDSGLSLTITNNNSAIGSLDGEFEDSEFGNFTQTSSGTVQMVKIANASEPAVIFGTANITASNNEGSPTTQSFDINFFEEIEGDISFVVSQTEEFNNSFESLTVRQVEADDFFGPLFNATVAYASAGEDAFIDANTFSLIDETPSDIELTDFENVVIAKTLSDDVTINFNAEGINENDSTPYNISFELEL